MRHRIEYKIGRVSYYLSLLQTYGPECESRFGTDAIYEGALLHYLYLVSDGCIALAEMMLKYKKCARSQSYFESIDLLGECGVLPRDFAYRFAMIASFRNFLAHDYEKVDKYKICKEALAKLDDIDCYLDFIKKSL